MIENVKGANEHQRVSMRKITRRNGLRDLGLAAALCFLVPHVSLADEPSGVRDALDDARLYFTAPARWDEDDWFAFAGSLALVAGAHGLDSRVRSHFATGSSAALNGGQDKNSARDTLPTVAIIGGTFVYAGLTRDSDGLRETWSLFEAGVLSTVTAEGLSYAFGRERPDATSSPNEWGKGADSFPSVHATAAFAVGTVFAESGNDDYRWIRRVLGYGVAGATAYIRLHENVHWLSDTVAGSALGIATARFVLNRQGITSHATVGVQPIRDGWMVSYCRRF